MAVTYFNPIVHTTPPSEHGLLDYDDEQRIDIRSIHISGLISTDSTNVIKPGTDGKLFSLGGGSCTFNVEDLLSAEAGNMSRPSTVDGLLYTDMCKFNTSDFVSTDVDNDIKFGSDGLLYVDGSEECTINIANLISTEAGNSITISIVDGKLYVVDASSCTYNIIDFISIDAGNEISVGSDGKLHVENLVCEWPIIDLVSNIANNRIRINTTGDGKLYVIPKDLVSTTLPNTITLDSADNLLRVNPKDIVSSDANSGLVVGSDGKLTVDFGAYWINMFATDNFKLHSGPFLPTGGTWAYFCIQPYWDADLGGDAGHRWSNHHRGNYLRHIIGAGVGAGGSWIPDVPLIDYFGHDKEQIHCISLVWRVA